ncbi:putative transcriptional regulator, LuxR family [Gordonia polyisoprenivorans VH2]|uniref:Helix-turn-helix transcriptional regulator n=2 Tax=Gordonia polyisoprenivorans TaxID=84595 RepID=A0A846WGW3_9ACTN|nr:helix-turn-helix transcriptional regulator [Gordonia polyisoprenivorans]AFA71965.1 putative transcriptional regulator, LuxR family [Gordonia polyisoprenivorans VH2]NKY00140.1 helix-turn-helix transcriptional regulator [Gordonia polyisoprenivorans]WCB38342.1 helix-turn-helix transcriptional regulator [Gordonia polyisoprenivorans]GAB25762.1 putative LuxR family transcriptional regulator [Gordonia polyisoprenivorans NBRC 16320 = JCM 10675]
MPGARSTGRDHTHLEVEDYDRIFGVLERVQDAESLTEFTGELHEALGTRFDLRNTTCFTGPTYDALFDDPQPVLQGRMLPLFRIYHAGLRYDDVFRLPEAHAILARTAALSAHELKDLPTPTRDYLARLRDSDLDGVRTIYLRHPGGHSLIGLFSHEAHPPKADMAVLRLLGKQLAAIARHLPEHRAPALTKLTRRQQEVAQLVAQGLTNAEIAAVLVVAEDTVKKHMSQILAVTGCRSRTELALCLG